MNAEREAAIRARLERLEFRAEWAVDGLCTGLPLVFSMNTGGQVADCLRDEDADLIANAPADIAYLLALVDRQATALDAVRELADEWGADHYCDIEATDAADDLRAALAAADHGGTRGRRSAADGSQGHSGACDGDQGERVGWFADIDAEMDGPYQWQPCLETRTGIVPSFDMYFATEADCHAYIHESIIPKAGRCIDDHARDNGTTTEGDMR